MPLNSTIKTIAIGSDHGGFETKKQLFALLQQQGYQVEDVGVYKEVSVDYPLFAFKVASLVASGACDCGIVVDGAGIGSCMAANKVPGIRAAMCYDVQTARNSREHNNANVLTLGGKLLDFAVIREIVNVWLTTECTEARHLRRANQIIDIERGGINDSSSATVENKVNNLSSDDLAQIARQITEILQSQGIASGSGCTCCGGSCGGGCAENAPETVQELITIGASRISYRGGNGDAVSEDLAGYIDHTLLKPDATSADVQGLCEVARQHTFASVCVSPTYVPLAAKLLKGSPVKVCTVIGFPTGTHQPQIKALETRQAIREGAQEIDMVINIGALKSRDIDLLYRDIRSVVESCQDGGAICKVIIETALLTDEEKVIASETARRARADFVKTSTGFSTGGATAHDVAIMAKAVRGSGMGVKASGGIRSFEDAMEMIEAGATRIGASASVQIVKGDPNVTQSGY